jgi:hypothetical protein
MTKKKKTEKKEPLDMTTDEAAEYLFGSEAARKLKEIAHGGKQPPNDEGNGSKVNTKSTRKHGTT